MREERGEETISALQEFVQMAGNTFFDTTLNPIRALARAQSRSLVASLYSGI